MSKTYAHPLAVATLALSLAVGTAGCQTLSDLDPTGLIGGDDNSSANSTQFPPDSQQQATQDANTTTPDLASLPARPAQPDASAQANTTQQVSAAGAQAQNSADALRAGTDAAAPPPVATDTAAARQALASANDAPPTAGPPSAGADAPPTAGSEQSAPPTASAAPPMASPPPSAAANPNAAVPARQQVASAAPPVAQEAPPSAAPPSAAAPVAEAAAPAAVATASLPPPNAEPAVPAVPMTPGAQMAMINPSDSQLGFKPSAAPPLNPGVTQWVSPPVLAHYRETAAQADSAGISEPAVAAVPAISSRTSSRRRGRSGAIAPAISGDVVANLDAMPGTPMGRAAAMNGGMAPTAIVYFPGDTTKLSKSALAQVRNAVAAFQAGGGTGTVKVVGHSSSRTANMPVERHLEVIFQKSQARADAVAQALIKAGIPADKVQIEAVGDSQPIYYESMPKGEDGNRRAEIFVQG